MLEMIEIRHDLKQNTNMSKTNLPHIVFTKDYNVQYNSR